MATIVDYLPKETQEEVQESQSSFRDAFNVPKEKTETVDKAKPKRSRSSGGSSRRSSGGGGSSTTSQKLPQSTIETPTPAAAKGQTMESVRQKSQTLKRQLNERQGTITAAPEPGRFDTIRQQLETRRLRDNERLTDPALSAAVGAGSSLRSTARGFYSLFGAARRPVQTGKKIFNVGKFAVTQPKQALITVGGEVEKAGARAGTKLREDPSGFFGYAAAEAGQAVVGGKLLSKGGKLASKTSTRLSSKYRPASGDKIKLTDRGSDFDIKLITGTKSGEIPLREQVQQAGKTAQPVSAQRSLYGRFFDKNKKVDKPKPSPDAPELERSFFADPKGRLRKGRLGADKQREAGVVDILSGDYTLKRQKPQALVFPESKVEPFPKNLKDVEVSLRSAKPLTPEQQARLEKFQMQPTGQFKPVGFQSKEAEITLPPGTIIKKERTLGKTLINDRPVDIFGVSVKKTSDDVIDIFKKPSPSKRDIRKLSKETGLPTSSFIPDNTPSLGSSRVVGASAPVFTGGVSGRSGASSVGTITSPAPSGGSGSGRTQPTVTVPSPSGGGSGKTKPSPIISGGSSGGGGGGSTSPPIKPVSSPPSIFRGTPRVFSDPFKKIKDEPTKRKVEPQRLITKTRQPFRYTPSFTGSAFKIKGRPKYLGKSVGYNPLDVRGLAKKPVKPLKTKKKKKKKRFKII